MPVLPNWLLNGKPLWPNMAGMNSWFSRLAARLTAPPDLRNGPWIPPSAGWGDVDADVRRLRRDLDAIRVRYSGHL